MLKIQKLSANVSEFVEAIKEVVEQQEADRMVVVLRNRHEEYSTFQFGFDETDFKAALDVLLQFSKQKRMTIQ